MFFCCIALLIAAQGTPNDTLWTESNEYCSISVHYPTVALENEAVGERLEDFASGLIQSFKEQLKVEFQDDPLLTGWSLEINFTHEPSPEGMICILAWNGGYTGGAHGNSWTQSFIFDLAAGAFIGPVELLGSQAELEAFAEKVMVQLDETLIDEAWLEDGASPTIENYHTVFPVPDENGGIAGYTVIFSPYQVACYATGSVEVYIPAE
ncbi:MAG: DUF4163 domain-containing protein [Candidatus Aegiribacteria sp.]|nr:DUF4163 domain-containing protein [Candidatus Aegiribacteria sp.]